MWRGGGGIDSGRGFGVGSGRGEQFGGLVENTGGTLLCACLEVAVEPEK